MKKGTSLCELLGLTQLEAAVLFGVSRSTWSMVELGKRTLPLHANLLLAEILTHFKENEKQPKKTKPNEHVLLKQQQQLEGLKYQHELEKRNLTKQIAKIEKQVAFEQNRAELLAFLKNRKPDELKTNSTSRTNPSHILYARASTDYDSKLIALKLKQELLLHKQSFIEAKLQNLTPTPAVKGKDKN